MGKVFTQCQVESLGTSLVECLTVCEFCSSKMVINKNCEIRNETRKEERGVKGTEGVDGIEEEEGPGRREEVKYEQVGGRMEMKRKGRTQSGKVTWSISISVLWFNLT